MVLFSLIFYLMVLSLSGSVGHTLTGLISLEILSWVFIMMMPSWMGLGYLMIQGIFFLASVLGLIWMMVVITASLLMKLGLPPFHGWLARITHSQPRYCFVFLLTIHKLLPLSFLAKLSKSWLPSMMIYIMSVSLAGLMMSTSSLGLMVIYSSFIHSLWMVAAGLNSLSLLLYYWTLYSALSISLVYSLNSGDIKVTNQSGMSSIHWLLLSGLPPFFMFWLKAHILTNFLFQSSLMGGALMLMSSVVALSAYYRLWHFSEFIVCLIISLTWMMAMFVLSMATL